MQTSAPGATQSLRPTGLRMLDVVAIGRKRASEKILSPAASETVHSRAASTERLLVDSADIGTRLAHPAVTEGKELGRLWPIAPRKCRIAEEKILSPALQLQALGKLSKKKNFEKNARCRS